MTETARIGLFVCECGDKIAGALDEQSLVERGRELPGVVWAVRKGYWCLPGGVELMRATVAAQQLDRAVIAGCAPRTHDPLFRRALDGLLNPTLIQVTNLRDLCALPHRDEPGASLAKAHDQIAMAVAESAGSQAGAPRKTRITPHVVVIGGGIAGMTAALSIGEANIPVTFLEREQALGGMALMDPMSPENAKLVSERIEAIRSCGMVRVLTNTQIEAVGGTVGCYHLTFSNGEGVEAGAIVVASGARSNSTSPCPPFSRHYAFLLCDISPERLETCSHTCCLAALARAVEIKRESPGSEVTIFFREIYTAGGTYNDLVWEAQEQGVNWVRYPAGRVPEVADDQVATYDELSGRAVRVSCDQFIACTPISPQDDAAHLAAMLRLSIDLRGFMPEARLRLRPADRIERGIYVCGAAHYPCDLPRATLQAYDAAARAVHHLQREEIVNWAPAVSIDATRCNGCGDCVRVCPFTAVRLEPGQGDKGTRGNGDTGTRGHGDAGRGGHGDTSRREGRPDGVRLAVVDDMLCTGCGNCASVCPVKAAQVPSETDERIEERIGAALGGGKCPGTSLKSPPREETEARGQEEFIPIPAAIPRVLVFACEWSGLSAAEIAGAHQLSYPACTRLIRVNCTGRLQPGLLLKPLEMGAAGVVVLGCAPGVCHHERGNEHAAAVFAQASALVGLMGLDKRLAMKWIPPDDGEMFVWVVEEFVESLHAADRKATGLEDHEQVLY